MLLKHQIIQNSFSNLLQLIISTLLGLILPSYILSKIGVESYGIWILMLALTSYIQILDLGSSSAITKLIAETTINKDSDTVYRYIGSILIIILVGVLTSIIFAIILFPKIQSFFPNEIKNLVNANYIFVGFIIVAALSLFSDIFSCVLRGNQRIDLLNYINIGILIIYFFFVILFLRIGWGLNGILISQLISNSIRLCVILKFSSKLIIVTSWKRLLLFDKMSFRKIFSLSSSDQSQRVLGIFQGLLTKLLIQRFAGTQYLTFYDLATRIISQVSIIPSIMFGSIVPAISELNSKKDNKRIASIVNYSFKYTYISGTPLVFFIFGFTNHLVTVWLGTSYPEVVITTRILIISTLINILMGPFYHTLIGLGLPCYGRNKSFITFFIYLILVIVFTSLRMQYYGIILSESISLVIGAYYLFFMFVNKLTYFDKKIFMSFFVKTFGVILICIISTWLLITVINNYIKYQNFIFWLIIFSIYMLFILVSYYKAKIIEKPELDLVKASFLHF